MHYSFIFSLDVLVIKLMTYQGEYNVDRTPKRQHQKFSPFVFLVMAPLFFTDCCYGDERVPNREGIIDLIMQGRGLCQLRKGFRL